MSKQMMEIWSFMIDIGCFIICIVMYLNVEIIKKDKFFYGQCCGKMDRCYKRMCTLCAIWMVGRGRGRGNIYAYKVVAESSETHNRL